MALPGGLTTPDQFTSLTGGVVGPGKSKAVVTSNVQTRGAFAPPYTPANFTPLSINASANADTGQLIVSANAASAAIIVTLPKAYYANGQFIHIIKTDSTANQVSAAVQTGDTLGRAAAKAWPVAQYETVTLVAQVDSSGQGIWYVLQ
jgi:hypothetical protein